MNIALLAADIVGHDVAKFFGESNEPLTCLILDSKDEKGLNAEILADCGIKERSRVFHSDSLYEEKNLNALKKMKLDLAILAWWPYILREELIGIPRIGCLNFHPSYLPHNRGKDPNFWAIVEDMPFGVSLHFVDTGVDSGDIAFQSVIEKSWEDTGKTLYEKALKEIVKLFKNNFEQIKSGTIPRKRQDITQASFHKRSELEAGSMINLDKCYNARGLLNIIRARTFHPYPAAWFVDNGEKYEVRTEITRISDEEYQ